MREVRDSMLDRMWDPLRDLAPKREEAKPRTIEVNEL